MTIRGHSIFEARQLVLFSAAAIVLLVFVWTRPLRPLTCRAEQVVAECPAKAGNGVRRVSFQGRCSDGNPG